MKSSALLVFHRAEKNKYIYITQGNANLYNLCVAMK